MIMILHNECLDVCRNPESSLKQSFCSASDINLLGNLYYVDIILHTFIRLSALNSLTCFITGNML